MQQAALNQGDARAADGTLRASAWRTESGPAGTHRRFARSLLLLHSDLRGPAAEHVAAHLVLAWHLVHRQSRTCGVHTTREAWRRGTTEEAPTRRGPPPQVCWQQRPCRACFWGDSLTVQAATAGLLAGAMHAVHAFGATDHAVWAAAAGLLAAAMPYTFSESNRTGSHVWFT